MTFLKSLWTDLVEKRLWPVAVVLLLALIAVPVALGGGSDAVETPVGATGPTGGAGLEAQVSLDPGAPVRRDRLGKVRDPFKQRAVKAATGATGTTGAAATDRTSEPDPAPDTPTDTTPAPPVPTPDDDAKPAPAPKPTYTTTVRLARVTAKERRAKEVEQLTPLPSQDDPFLVYLGVLANGRTAVFLLSSDVTSEGDGTCRPRRSSCETVELDRGEEEVLSVMSAGGAVRRYQLDVVRVERTGTSTAQAPVTAVKKKKAAPDTDLGTDDYALDEDAGVLRRVKASAGLGAHLPTADAEAATLASVRAWLPTGDELEPMPEFVPEA